MKIGSEVVSDTLDLFGTFQLGRRTLKNRVVMAPLTRARCRDLVPGPPQAEYYGQRASAGLIVSEGTPISEEGQGYINVPGIWTDAQEAGWRLVTDAVHAAGGVIFSQLWHVGRVSHASLQPDGGRPVSSTNRPAVDKRGQCYILDENGNEAFALPDTPRALRTDEMPRIVEDFANAARRADRAGFDGIELHGANGYLFEQFLNPVLNDRTDAYGGSLENRMRLLMDVVDAVTAVLGKDRVGVRLAPFNRQHDMAEYAENAETYLAVARALSKRGIVYLHMNDNWSTGKSVIPEQFLADMRAAFSGAIILAGGNTRERAERLIGAGLIDLAAFGQHFISNPDLVERMRNDWPLTPADRVTFYGGGAEGYTDYPTHTA